MTGSRRPSARQLAFAEIHDRALQVASDHLRAEAEFVGSRDWVIFLFSERFPNVYPTDLDRRLLGNFVQQAAYHGMKLGLIKAARRPDSARLQAAT